MRLPSRTRSLLVVVGLVGCHTATDPATTRFRSGGDFTIGITAGTTPTFSWPGAGASRISVTTATYGGIIPIDWEIASAGQISSPVQYGSRPSGSTVVTSAQTLATGTRYEVTVSRSDGRSAYQEFMP